MEGYKLHFSDEEKEVETRGVTGLCDTEISLVGSEKIKHAMKQYIKSSVGSLIYLGNVLVVDGVQYWGNDINTVGEYHRLVIDLLLAQLV